MKRIGLALTLALAGQLVPEGALAQSRTRRARVAQSAPRRNDAVQLGRTGSAATRPTLEDRLREELESIWASRVLRRGITAVYVVDGKSGVELFSTHADDRLNPASNVKLISTATVLDTLGPDWRYTTQLFGPAVGPDGVLKGSLYLRGSGDPTLGRGALDDLARGVAVQGVTRVEGDVVLSDEILRDALGSGEISLTVDGRGRPGSAPQVSVSPATAFVDLHVSAKVSSSRRARLTASSRIVDDPVLGPRLRIDLGGTIRQGQRRSVSRPVERRSTYTAHLLREALAAAGVAVTGRPRLASFADYVAEGSRAGFLPVVLATHRSATLGELVAIVNKRSTNWLADRLVMTAGAELIGEPPTMETAVKAMRQWLVRAGLDPSTIVIDTGSGLSYATKLSARQLVQILRVTTGQVGSPLGEHSLFDAEAFRRSLAVGGVDGTLRGRFTRMLRGSVLGKTGTLTGCVALSGLVSGGGGDSLCFSIVTNGHRNRSRVRNDVRHEHDQMVRAMSRYLEARAVAGAAAGAVAEAVASVPEPAVPAPPEAAEPPARGFDADDVEPDRPDALPAAD